MMTLAYRLEDSLYLNITNKCCCACVFCLRMEHDGVGDGDNLWLEREPTAGEVIADLERLALTDYREVVFCGYGEPTESLEVLLEVARYLRSKAPGLPIRLNTNGLGDLINGRDIAPLLAGLVDIVSVSLNAPDARSYQEIVNSAYGEASFDAMLRFAARAKEFVPDVRFTVVDTLPPEDIAACRAIAERLGVALRVRTFV